MNLLQEIHAPQEGSVTSTVTVVKLHFANGTQVAKGDMIIELETAKSTFPLAAETDGYIEYLCRQDEDVPVGALLARITDLPPQTTGPRAQDEALSQEAPFDATAPVFSQAARRMMQQHHVDPQAFSGRDFVDTSDVQAYLEGPASGFEEEALARQEQSRQVNYCRLNAAKREEIAHLAIVNKNGLCSTIHVIVETRGLFEAVNPRMRYFRDSLLPLAVYESGRLLRKYPAMNAFFHADGLAEYKDVHIGVAVDINHGLKVVTIRSADQKSIQEIELSLFELIERYSDNTLMLSDMTASTFTIADLSVHGASFFIPLINARQSAILGISAVDHRLSRCVLSLTFDHRVSSGKEASWFLCELKERLESYAVEEDQGRQTTTGPTQDKTEADPAKKLQCQRCLKDLGEDEGLGGPGFVRLVNHQGQEIYLCRACFMGW